MTVHLTKAVRGQNFEDLDLLAKLLAPRKSERTTETPLIEVLDTQEAISEDDELAARTEGLSLADQEILEGGFDLNMVLQTYLISLCSCAK